MKWRLSRPGKWSRSGAAVVIMAGVLLLGGGAAAYLGGVVKSITANNVDLQKGLVGWWQMNGNAMDSTPYSDNGTVNGASLTADRKGKSNSAYSFTRTNSNYISVTDSTALNFGTGDLAISVWFKVSSITTASQQIICKRDSTGDYEVQVNANDGHVYAYLGSTAAISSAAVTPGVWYHVVASRASGVTTLYLNSAVSGSANSASTASSVGTPLNIGRDVHSTAEYFDGSISDVRIWKRALSQTEVSALYNEYNPGIKADFGENGLVGWWKLDGNGKDSSPYGNNATLTNATLTTDRKNAANSAYSFNGTSSEIGMTVPQAANLNSYSFTVWFDPTANSNTVADGIFGNTNNPRLTWGNSVTAGLSVVQLLIGHQGGGNGCNVTTANITQNTWHQAAVTVTNSNTGSASCSLYIDGNLYGSSSGVNTPWTLPQSGWWLGNRDGTTRFPGSVDDARIYNRVLSSADISNLYKSYNSQVAIGGSPGSSIQLGKGLVGDWPFNGSLKDATPFANIPTLHGPTLTADRKGRNNSAYGFVGASSQWMQVPAAAFPSYPASGNTSNYSQSFSVWFQTTSNGPILGQDIGTVLPPGLPSSYVPALLVDPSGKLSASFFWHNSNFNSIVSAASVNDGSWHNAVDTYSGGVEKLYLDGVQVGTQTFNEYSYGNGTYNYFLGVAYGAPQWSSLWTTQAWKYFTGSLDDARVWNRALNAAEVSALYNEYR